MLLVHLTTQYLLWYLFVFMFEMDTVLSHRLSLIRKFNDLSSLPFSLTTECPSWYRFRTVDDLYNWLAMRSYLISLDATILYGVGHVLCVGLFWIIGYLVFTGVFAGLEEDLYVY